MGEFKLTEVLSERRLYELFGEIGQRVIDNAKADKLDDETRVLLTLSCEGILEALSAAPSKLIGMGCPECGRYKPVPLHPVDVNPSTHTVILTSGGTTLRCDCGHQLGKWDEDAEKWIDLPIPVSKKSIFDALKIALESQAKMLDCIRDAFQARDSLIELIRILQQNGTLNEEELGDQRHLLSMQLLPERTYRELTRRESVILESLEKLNGERHVRSRSVNGAGTRAWPPSLARRATCLGSDGLAGESMSAMSCRTG